MATARKPKAKVSAKTVEVTPVPEAEAKKETINRPVRNEGNLFSVKLDNKKFSNRTIYQVMSLVEASQGAVTKIIIELEDEVE